MTLHCVKVPAPGFHKNPGKFPDEAPKDIVLRVQCANGYIDWNNTYTPSQLRWTLTGSDWDIGAVAEAGKVGQHDGRQENGSYE